MKNYIITLFFISIIFANEDSCTKCHKDKLNKCKNSLHYTLSKSINITRNIWGISDSNITLQTLPKSKKNIKKPKDLVDDFLRRKCLRCHLKSKSINPTKNICLACHNKHTNKFDIKKAKPTQKKCLKCHNNNYIGTDYLGLFPHDFDKAYRSPISKDGYYPKRPYGIDFHHLTSDIHYNIGMSCINCHKGVNWEEKVSCSSCHTNLSKHNHKSYHDKLSCSSCHSSWSMSNYELNVFRDDTKNYKQWKRLVVQDDKYLERFLKKALKNPLLEPKMADYITNKLEDGVWYSGYRFRRWENIYLVNDKNGKIKLARPLYQYRISYKDKNGSMVLDDIYKIDGKKIEAFLPFSPHTISKEAKSCQMCHENKLFFDNHLINKDILTGKVINGSNLTHKQIEKLHSKRYKKEFFINTQ